MTRTVLIGAGSVEVTATCLRDSWATPISLVPMVVHVVIAHQYLVRGIASSGLTR